MSRPSPIHLFVTILDEPGLPVLLVAGIPGDQGEVAFVQDGLAVRALWPSRAPSARRPERPIAPGLPSLNSILCAAVLAEEVQ
ncbi:hypothetical protein D3093_30040 (plasmid) [Azospirillum argentinense]|uniref:Uncharacterized protein n=1 Tax=Azospirillum argentinense TaxID=2970906 RepID=A0A4D8PMZ5_9PROT|nr:hypothetical protein [Azospirillum argentinense]QCN98895.1 hypothetical protein D3093_26780 [Azospirillum argentinense]QCN99466.1 hypothetical protein D3093_30040 [Azospirillum argentinense]